MPLPELHAFCRDDGHIDMPLWLGHLTGCSPTEVRWLHWHLKRLTPGMPFDQAWAWVNELRKDRPWLNPPLNRT